MKRRVRAARSLTGEIHLPSDKSISHRAVILNSIAEGTARIKGFSHADDCLTTVSCLRALGVKIEADDPSEIVVEGRGGKGLKEAEDVLDAGNSGTTMRILAGLLSVQPFLSVITGDASLRSRPMDRIIKPLRLMGAQIWGRCDDSRAPLVIKGGNLNGIHYELPVPSAQLKSAILLAGLGAEGDTIIEEPVKSRDHTERMLKAMGANIKLTPDKIFLSPGRL
ncbi:MAG: 3-phosphoshikimate 1-carboxyvinyltransferase, partial [Dehalococcoidales bacterium]|nr:3-phosphoshikimate 1-carboxyvinyltransferase [Dehalococcoidales bacterium]